MTTAVKGFVELRTLENFDFYDGALICTWCSRETELEDYEVASYWEMPSLLQMVLDATEHISECVGRP